MGRYTGRKCRLLSMLVLTSSFFFVEIIVGYVTNSMALVADSFHMLSDVAALIIAFLSVKMSPKKWSKNTFGWARAEVLGALVNAVFLVALCFSILVESLKRLWETEEIHNEFLMLVVGCIGLLVNIAGLFLFHQHGSSHGHSHGGGGGHHHHNHRSSLPKMDDVNTDEDENDNREGFHVSSRLTVSHDDNAKSRGSASQMNMRGVFLHVLADALGSVIVIISALVIWLSNWEYKYYIDPALSIFMVVLILLSVWPLLVESALILLQTVPTHIQVEAIQKKLLKEIDGVMAVHEFHVWQLAGDRIIASAHIRCRNLADYMLIAEKVKEFFHNEGIHSTTIQPEFVELNDPCESDPDAMNCVLDCPSNKKCAASTCCGSVKKDGRESPSQETSMFPEAVSCRQRTTTSNCAGIDGDCPSYVQATSNRDHPSDMERGSLKSSNVSSCV